MKKIVLYSFILVTFILQGQNKLESSLIESYNNGVWYKSAGVDYTYDANNNLTREDVYWWGNGAWELHDKRSYTFNANNKITESLTENWTGFGFVNFYKVTYTYNSSGQIVEMFQQEWENGQWRNAGRTTISYTDNLPTVIILTGWNNTTMQWVDSSRHTMSYNGNLPITRLVEFPDGSNWVTGARTNYVYNSLNKRTAAIFESWNNNQWTDDSRFDFLIDTYGNKLRESHSMLGTALDKVEYTYDLTAQLSGFAHPFNDKTGIDYLWEDMPHVSKILYYDNYNYDTATSTYNLYSRTTHNYNHSVLATENFVAPTVHLYPNPSSDSIQLTGLTHTEKMTAYNILGIKVLENAVDNNQSISVDHLASGLYILKLENGNTLNFVKK
jgi:hypothetical protein